MGWLAMTLLILWVGFKAYAGAKATGTWSTKVFLGVMLGVAALGVIIAVPIFLIPQDTFSAHPGVTMIGFLVVIAAGVVVITIYTNRWWKSVLAKRYGQNPPNPPGPA